MTARLVRIKFLIRATTLFMTDSSVYLRAGMFQPNEAMSGCYACPSGQFQESIAAVQCEKCPCRPGMYTTSTKQGMKTSVACGCQLCDAGKYSDIDGLQLCKVPPPPHLQPSMLMIV